MLDHRPAAGIGPGDGDDIESRGELQEAVPL
jgi:hypothetical protein